MTQVSDTTSNAEPILRLRGVGRRFGGVQAVKSVDLDVDHGERRAVLGPNGAGKTTLFNTYQKSRLFLGLSVEDNLYLALVGREGGRLRPIVTRRDAALRERAREAAERVWLGHHLSTQVGSLSHGEQRQLEVGMASVTEPKLMMLDEPASGLSRGEREKLTELLLGLDPAVTLILIEHDMDVALRVAENVTMMHDGRKIVEGTPDEIRANEQVHELYLGGRVTDEGIEVAGE